ncbi:hypothetical protein Bbelb_284230 [Branchiostoma belcheri]|nr:hypothetical protein Bbelb_284230 [Branchiostoma belcheri]
MSDSPSRLRTVYVVCTPRLAVSGCVHRSFRKGYQPDRTSDRPNAGGKSDPYRPDRESDRPKAEGYPTRGRAGTEGDAEYTVLYFIYVIPTQENVPFNAR